MDKTFNTLTLGMVVHEHEDVKYLIIFLIQASTKLSKLAGNGSTNRCLYFYIMKWGPHSCYAIQCKAAYYITVDVVAPQIYMLEFTDLET